LCLTKIGECRSENSEECADEELEQCFKKVTSMGGDNSDHVHKTIEIIHLEVE
jgi:hypothetical protein